MSSIRNLSSDKGTIHLEGDLTLSNAAELRTMLIKALIDADAVRIRFGAVQDLDLSCLQLFCSAHRSAVRLKKQIQFEENPPKILQETAEAAGYSRVKGCQLDSEKSCLWVTFAGVHHG
jgi:ABC-type transporter Mla MlaB component